MSRLEEAVKILKNAISKSKANSKAQCLEAITQLQSYLVFLKSSEISAEAATKISERFRTPLVSVYTAFPQPALRFAAVLSQEIYETKILAHFTAGKLEQKQLWDRVLHAVLAGVLDYYDQNDDDKCKEAIGNTLYSTLCSIFFSVSISHMSIELRCTGYSLLSECADSHKSNQKRLQDAKVLGGPKLGGMLWRTRDFLVMEIILNLFARMIPPTNGNSAGRANRNAFIRSVFVQSSPDDVKTGEELARMMETVSSADWDLTSSRIVDILAQSNIAFPQPFKVTEVVVCGESKPSDRIYVDEKGFVGNVLVEDDMYESLCALYSAIRNVQISYRGTTNDNLYDNPQVTVYLRTPPTIGKEPIHPETLDGKTTDPTIVFTVCRNEIPRFHEALKSRGMHGHVKIVKGAKLSLAESATNLEMDSAGQLIGRAELEQRIENLSQLYGTNDPSDDLLSNRSFVSEDHDVAALAFHDDAPLKNVIQSNQTTGLDIPDVAISPAVAVSCVSAPGTPPVDLSGIPCTKAAPTAPLFRTTSQVIRDTCFGTSDDELSDVRCLSMSPSRARTPSIKPAEKVAVSARPRKIFKGKQIDDWDDEVADSTPIRSSKVKQRGKKTLVFVSDEDEIEEIVPMAKIDTSSISRRRSVLTMTDILSSAKSGAVSIRRTTQTKKPEKVPSKLPEEPPAQKPAQKIPSPTTILDSSEFRSNLEPGSTLVGRTSLVSAAVPNTPLVKSSDIPFKSAATPRKQRDRQQASQSSSPIPAIRAIPRSVKSAPLKDQNQASGKSSYPTSDRSAKRKRGLEDEAGQSPKKRPAVSENAIQSVKTESHVLKAGGFRPTKRYRGKKGRTSSPVPSIPGKVDYDKIPDAPPPALVHETKVASSPQDVHREEKEKVTKASDDSKPTTRRTKAATMKSKKKQVTCAESTRGTKNPSRPKNLKLSKLESNIAETDHVGADHPDIFPAGLQPLTDEANDTPQREKVPERASTGQETTQQSLEVNKNMLPMDVTRLITEIVEETPANPKTVVSNVVEQVLLHNSPSSPVLRKQKSKRPPWDEIDFFKPTLQDVEIPPSPVDEVLKDEKMFDLDITLVEADIVAKNHGRHKIELDYFPKPSSNAKLSVKQAEDASARTDSNLGQSAQGETPPNIQMSCIDLTMEDMSTRQKPTPVTKSTISTRPQPAKIAVVDDVRYLVPDLPFTIPSSTPRPRPSVTFAENVAENKYPFHKKLHATANPPPSKHTLISPSAKRLRAAVQTSQRKMETNHFPSREAHPGIEELASVIEEIHQALLRKINGKVEGVRHEVRIGRDSLLMDAASDLRDMYSESAGHYNRLIEFEAEYATFGRNLIHGFDDLLKIDQEIHQEIQKIIQAHDRSTLSQKMPTSLFSTGLPAAIMNYHP